MSEFRFRFALLLLASTTALSACGGSSAPPTVAKPAVLVRVAKAEKTTVPFIVRAPGLVMASETVEVHARADSQVVEVHFHEGDMVHAGQLLFTLDDRALRADLGQQEANLATGQADLDNAGRQFDRARKLAAGGFESTAELDKARADYEMANAKTTATKAAIERLRVMIDYTRITAAIDGRAGAIAATVGNTVKANDVAVPLVVINRVSPIRVQIGLPQQALAPLRDQMEKGTVEARVIRDGNEIPEHGRIEFVDNAINRTTATFESRAHFENTNEVLWPGMIVEVLIRLGEDAGVVAVPEVAVQHGASGDFVFIVENAVAHRRAVKVTRYGEGVAVIVDGLQGGEMVTTDGMLSLSEGTPVDVPEAKPPGAAKAPAADAKAPAAAAESAPK